MTSDLQDEILACRICAERFAATETAHTPRPVAWFQSGARILIAGQAPGMRVHESGVPFQDRSGERLRQWLGVTEDEFYDRSRVAILPMGFCFPGYNDKGSDLPPPKVCARTWRERAMESIGEVGTTVLIGGYAQKWHLGDGAKGGVTETVRRWREHPDGVFAVPHPSWRNQGWLKKNPWFEDEVLPRLRARVREVLA